MKPPSNKTSRTALKKTKGEKTKGEKGQEQSIRRKKNKGMMLLAYRIATLGNVGYWSPAPGSWASALTVLGAWGIIATLGITTLAILTGIILILSFPIVRLVLTNEPSRDPSHIVVDEWIGQCLVILAIYGLYGHLDGSDYVLSFILFRVFDILKPWPIRSCENWHPAEWAVIADDIAAAFFAVLTFALINMPWDTMSWNTISWDTMPWNTISWDTMF